MRFIPSGEEEGPPYLYQHADGSTKTSLRRNSRTCSSVVPARVPWRIYFWCQWLHGIHIGAQFTLNELTLFLGIMSYMAVNDKGECANYWASELQAASSVAPHMV
ncbi:hypothetical protein GQ600_19799 [Phytophthora cactorum]|nr:hypothetical protein GQ600_19799 [Phytophthora cactorum]